MKQIDPKKCKHPRSKRWRTIEWDNDWLRIDEKGIYRHGHEICRKCGKQMHIRYEHLSLNEVLLMTLEKLKAIEEKINNIDELSFKESYLA